MKPGYDIALREDMAKKRAARPWVLITGASRGLGRELALAFARGSHDTGNNIILHHSGRHPQSMENVVEHLHELRALTSVVGGDLVDHGTISRLAVEAISKNISVLVNNAGAYTKEDLDNLSDAAIHEMLLVNLVAPIMLTRACMPALRAQKGIVVNINSLAARTPSRGESVYAATKAGLEGFSKAYKLETMPVRIIDVFLGAMNTRMALMRANADMLIKPEAAAAAIAQAVKASHHDQSLRVDSMDLRRGWY